MLNKWKKKKKNLNRVGLNTHVLGAYHWRPHANYFQDSIWRLTWKAYFSVIKWKLRLHLSNKIYIIRE